MRRFLLAEIVRAAEHSPDHDHESPLGYRFLVETSRRTRPYWVWCWRPFDVQETSGSRHSPRLVSVVVEAIRQATTERQRAVLAATYGLGPWSEEIRREVECLAPGLEALAPRGDHRSAVEETLADWRGAPWPDPFDGPESRTQPSYELSWPTPYRPGFVDHAAWRALIDGLDARAQVGTAPEWQAYLAELMHCAQAHLRVEFERRSPLRKRLLNGL
ncbi:hypothetical protein ACFC58_29370 [Kitasatospora purpeofusca]|uniref:hypothetical protein n=1 Tax=Kitasatospora purpeofusca TaxID=67352 RepID=UPI0035DEAC2D